MASSNSLLLARLALLLFSPFMALAVLLIFVGLSAMMLFEACKRGSKELFLKNQQTSRR
jgi:hypothetical protein